MKSYNSIKIDAQRNRSDKKKIRALRYTHYSITFLSNYLRKAQVNSRKYILHVDNIINRSNFAKKWVKANILPREP